MFATLRDFYFRLILHKPRITFLLLATLATLAVWHSSNFRLDASSDSLLLENDQALKFYRAIEARYGSDDFLIITYTPDKDLFSEPVKKDLSRLRDSLKSMRRVESVLTVLDVPLINSPRQSLSDIQHKVLTLDSPETDQQMARQELLTSPLYKNLLVSSDGQTTAIQVIFRRDQKYYQLLEQRNSLREKALEKALTADEKRQLKAVSEQFNRHSISLQHQESEDIARVRQIMDQHRKHAHLFLGGIPMITSDSIDYIRHDLMTFGLGVLAFLVLLLAVFFHLPRWIFLPMLTCSVTGLFMVGFLGRVDWPVTVVSANFISLMLIITLSLIVHLIVRYRELQAQHADYNQQQLVREMICSKVQPSFFTAATTIVAFASLIISGIRPVIDFGWMMTIGISISFVIAFTLFPATLALLPVSESRVKHDYTAAITGFFARLIQRFGKSILLLFLFLALFSIAGTSRLTVENRFIDYYKENTEIYQGMSLIDNRLGGTTPLEVIIDAPADFFTQQDYSDNNSDPLFDELALELEEDEETGITGSSYWFNNSMLVEINRIHDYLEDLPETGKVLSISSSLQLFRSLDESMVMDDFFLSILYKRLPEDIKQSLFHPYMSKDGNQLRFSVRVYESDPTLKREALLNRIRQHLTEEFGLDDAQVHLTGMLVLYNNLLQSLFKSQILTIGVVFIAILLMFAISFRNLKMAALAILPNIVAAFSVLGLMGWLSIPLDIMTITIAAICIGIAVDDTIHYVHRFTEEFRKDGDYWASVNRSHNSIGRAMYYTSVTITLGFSILALSNFIPSIYFGLLTGFSMLIALIANLTLLPLLIVWLKPVSRPVTATAE